jgi:tetratricopeptide (TPR) repeat protein
VGGAGSSDAGHSSAGILGRRRRARVVAAAGGARCIPSAIAALADPDAGTRGELLAFLARDDLGEAGLTERIEAIAALSLSDPDLGLRARALGMLASLDRDESLARLDALLDVLPEPLRAQAALLLADRPRARKLLEKRLATVDPTAGSSGPARGVGLGANGDPAVLAPLLAGLGRILGDQVDAQRMAPVLRALRHADPRIRRGAQFGIDAFIRRLFAGAEAARASGAIRVLEDLGLDRMQGAMLRAKVALALGADPKPALDAASEMASFAPADGDSDARSTLAVARHLQAAALLAAGAAREAEAPIVDEASLLDGLLAERADRDGKSLASLHATRLHRRAQCEVLSIVQSLAAARAAPEAGSPETASDPVIARCVEAARRAHAIELEAQAAEGLLHSSGKASLDVMLDDSLSPVRLLLENPRLPAWPAPRALWMRRAIARLFASVARAEMPGFEPYADITDAAMDPLLDVERVAWLKAILRRRFDSVASRLQGLRGRVRGERAGDPTAPSDEEEREMQVALRDWEDLLEISQRVGQGETTALLESRAPSLQGLSLARALREEGRGEDARNLAEAVKKDLDTSGDLKHFLVVEAEIEMTIGSTWIDSGDPPRAEVELVRAVERLESIESSLRDRGSSPGDLAIVRGLRASALVSLAVNANVKMGDPKKALAYFERAFELRQDEFMRVLLACYRARSGRGEQARAILREISPTPANLYNVACTWALLGEKDLALECLKRDLEENPMSTGARDKQREWARKDPDLASLRGDARFRALVGE